MIRPTALTDGGTVAANDGRRLPPPGSLAAKLAELRDTPSAKRLWSLVADPLAWKRMVQQVFGQDISPQRSEALRRRLLSAAQSGDWSFIDVRVVKDSNPLVSGASAAYSGGDDRVDDVIFLALSTTNNLRTLEMPFFEELGHWIDDQLRDGGGDAIGDEGERFAARLAGKPAGEHALTEDDRRLIQTPNGISFTVENSAPVPTDAQIMAGQYRLLNTWSQMSVSPAGLTHEKFLAAINPFSSSPIQANPDLGVFYGPAFTYWINAENWKKFAGADLKLTLKELEAKIETGTPSDAERLRANYVLNDNWSAAAGNNGLTKEELLDALKPGSAFHNKALADIDAIDRVFVFWYQTFGTAPLTQKEVQSRISSLAPTGPELLAALKVFQTNWTSLIGTTPGLTPAELWAAMSPNSAFYKRAGAAEVKAIAVAVEYWRQHPVALFGTGTNPILTADELAKKINPPPISMTAVLTNDLGGIFTGPSGIPGGNIPASLQEGEKFTVQFVYQGAAYGGVQTLTAGTKVAGNKILGDWDRDGGQVVYSFDGMKLNARFVERQFPQPLDGSAVWALAVLRDFIPESGLSRTGMELAIRQIQASIPDGDIMLRSVLGFYAQPENWGKLVDSDVKLSKDRLDKKIGWVLSKGTMTEGLRPGTVFHKVTVIGSDPAADSLNVISAYTHFVYRYQDPITRRELSLHIGNPGFTEMDSTDGSGKVSFHLPKAGSQGAGGTLVLFQSSREPTLKELDDLADKTNLTVRESLAATGPMRYALVNVGSPTGFTVNGAVKGTDKFKLEPPLTDAQSQYLANWKIRQSEVLAAVDNVLRALDVTDESTLTLPQAINNAKAALARMQTAVEDLNAKKALLANEVEALSVSGVPLIWMVAFAERYREDIRIRWEQVGARQGSCRLSYAAMG